jgi:hypothetical protein
VISELVVDLEVKFVSWAVDEHVSVGSVDVEDGISVTLVVVWVFADNESESVEGAVAHFFVDSHVPFDTGFVSPLDDTSFDSSELNKMPGVHAGEGIVVVNPDTTEEFVEGVNWNLHPGGGQRQDCCENENEFHV